MNIPDLHCTSWSGARFDPSVRGGHYESYFLRANHPTRNLAFWIRYTAFSPKGRPAGDLGELWAIWFDGEQGKVVAAKDEFEFSACSFDPTRMNVRIGDSSLTAGALQGAAQTGDRRLQWNLTYAGDESPILLLPEPYYQRGLPKAKSVVTRPNVRFSGEIEVNGETMNIESWQGSENHNWGSKHTDEYAWGQVAGFDGYPDSFLEAISARIKLGPFWSPWLTLGCLRHDGRAYDFNQLGQAFSARSDIRFGGATDFQWSFVTENGNDRLTVAIAAPRQHFIGLNYYNPPGGSRTCLNSKVARCELHLESSGGHVRLHTKSRAAFELLTDRKDHGVPVLV